MMLYSARRPLAALATFATLVVLAAALPATAGAQSPPESPPESHAEPAPNGPDAGPDFERYVRRQAALELQIGLELYRQGDDYRAITALERHEILTDEPARRFATKLMIGHIYRRNERPALAIGHFERAFENAPTPGEGLFAYLLGLQELCQALGMWGDCYRRLHALRQVELDEAVASATAVRDLIAYQLLYTEVVLRSPHVTPVRAQALARPEFRERAERLVARSVEFDALPLKRPWLAGTLSAVVPGAGQLYNGRPADAAISFVFNALFAGATYYAFAELDSIPFGVTLGLITAGFYSGNIINAVTDARRVNAAHYERYFESLARDFWPRVGFTIERDEVRFFYRFDWPGETPPPPADVAPQPQPGPTLDDRML